MAPGRRDPAVRHLALRQLLDRPADDPDVVESLGAAMDVNPIASILAAQEPEGYWQKPGPGVCHEVPRYGLAADLPRPARSRSPDERVARACEYCVLSHSQGRERRFRGVRCSDAGPPPSSRVIHCLTGNLLRALIGFGWLDDRRVIRAVEWQAAAIAGEGGLGVVRVRYVRAGIRLRGERELPCAWGAVKALGGLARVPSSGGRSRCPGRSGRRRLPLSRDPVVADYPAGRGNKRPSDSWFKLGFPSGYVADVLQNLEVLAELGYAGNHASPTPWTGCWRSRTSEADGPTRTRTPA